MNVNEVPRWSGSPMDPENLGCVLPRGTTFCVVGDPGNFQGTAYLTQPQIELVRPGQAVTLKSRALPVVSFRGFISEVGTAITPEIPSGIASEGIVPTRTNRSGRLESADPVFVARIEISPESLRGNDLLPLHHSIGRITIQIDSQSLGNRIARFVYSTFSFDPTVQRRASP
jgi:putative peptide zinc metalloprotease protein